MKFVACIGGKVLYQSEKETCFNIGKILVEHGYAIKSGNADGADEMYAAGANSVNSSMVYLCLPWYSYERDRIVPGNYVMNEPKNEWFKIAERYHSNWKELGQAGRKLHARNFGIVENTECVIAFPRKGFSPGTGMGMRMAAAMGITVYNLRMDGEDSWKKIL